MEIDFSHENEDIQFSKDDDYLEINTWNAANEKFTIILDPSEIQKLMTFLVRNYGRI